MLRRGIGVWLPVSHDGVDGVVDSSTPAEDGEYMPRRVEEVRLRTERVLFDRLLLSSSSFEALEESLASLDGVGGVFGEEDSVDFDSSSNGRRGRGRRSFAVLDEPSSAITGNPPITAVVVISNDISLSSYIWVLS